MQNNMQKYQKYVVGSIIGICLTVTVASIWFLVAQNKKIALLEGRAATVETVVQQIVNLINQANQPAQ